MIKTVAARYPLLLHDKVLNASFINTNSCYSHDIIQPIKFTGPIPSIVPLNAPAHRSHSILFYTNSH